MKLCGSLHRFSVSYPYTSASRHPPSPFLPHRFKTAFRSPQECPCPMSSSPHPLPLLLPFLLLLPLPSPPPLPPPTALLPPPPGPPLPPLLLLPLSPLSLPHSSPSSSLFSSFCLLLPRIHILPSSFSRMDFGEGAGSPF